MYGPRVDNVWMKTILIFDSVGKGRRRQVYKMLKDNLIVVREFN
jgi:hypothetical protein